jgi:hypothetical protein
VATAATATPRLDPADLPFPPPPAGAQDYLLWADPLDPDPLAGRIALALVHGYRADDQDLPFAPSNNREFDTIRRLLRGPTLRRRFKPYLFSYRPHRAYPEVAVDLAGELRGLLGPPDRGTRLVVVANSGGAIAARYACADARLAPRVAGIITLSGANRGAVAASLVPANRSLRHRVGWLRWKLLQSAVRDIRVTPGLRSLAYDDYDGSIGGVLRDTAGVATNPTLRDFNDQDPNLDRLITYFGYRRILLRRGRRLWGIENQVHRELLRSVHESWGSADPLVHRASALLLGRPVLRRREFPGVDHAELASAPAILEALSEDLLEVARADRGRLIQGQVERASEDRLSSLWAPSQSTEHALLGLPWGIPPVPSPPLASAETAERRE